MHTVTREVVGVFIVRFSCAAGEELQSSQKKWKVIDLSTEQATFITGDNPFLINNKTFRMDNVF
jgi:hypothetical protein